MAAVFLTPPAAIMNEPEALASALLLIAHGSRRAEANEDLEHLAGVLRSRGRYAFVQTAFLELARPTIAEGGAACVAAGAKRVVLLPYFLSPGVHARDDLAAARADLAATFPDVEFLLAEPLGRHPLLAEIVAQRAIEVEGK
jgi:sirohydrochlorin ferrochelatase